MSLREARGSTTPILRGEWRHKPAIRLYGARTGRWTFLTRPRVVSLAVAEFVRGLLPQKLYVSVRTEPRVVRQVPAFVVGVLINDDLIVVPVPVVHETVVIRRHAKKEAVEPEAVSRAAFESELVTRAEAAGEATVFKGSIEVVVRIVAPGIVSDPGVVVMNVRSIRMTGHVGEMTSRSDSVSIPADRRRTVRRNVTTAEAAATVADASAATSATASTSLAKNRL